MNRSHAPSKNNIATSSRSFHEHHFDYPRLGQREPVSAVAVHIADLEQFAQDYLYDCDLRLQSPRTIETRRVFLRNFFWFLHQRNYATCGASEIRHFFHYLAHGHEEAGGRFGNKNLTHAVRPITVMDYYTCLRSLFDWLVAQRITPETPFIIIAKPQVREEIKCPLSAEQITALLRATHESADPLRNAALLLLLLDTGCRASELVALKRRDLDLTNHRCRVRGKGDKYRTLFFGGKTADTLSQYLHELDQPQPKMGQELPSDGDEPLFSSARSTSPLTRSGLLHLIKRLGKAAGIKDAVCVHALRRSFAVQMLKNGANVFSVQALLGHTNLQQTRKYCALAMTDTEAQHRQFSPVDRLVTT
ncbi:MAG: tyrosine-type recombinase/integrase [Abitibacteriaceae bacterium]|nr:tyrosine-type recombinase/integrase [Abditibacteriaceae bacterium]